MKNAIRVGLAACIAALLTLTAMGCSLHMKAEVNGSFLRREDAARAEADAYAAALHALKNNAKPEEVVLNLERAGISQAEALRIVFQAQQDVKCDPCATSTKN